ncbi:nitrilase-related carbon-nitrogen hydrolase [Alteribacillus sp. YIM 98480]|uniref:nitrilase-related carbon-nitrogen hydrolase n=1 Tax=Alteribacillus sp. YIM 98480 TaxID=2606599 RepID=UPI00131C45ED|nr:nitrilase-related carbon-nitrogen hydrolase [Alteribacillus sp. YIM 98480]
MAYDIYTAVAIQPEVKIVKKRSDIMDNLKRCLELIDAAPQVQPSAKEGFENNWAPIKLISFPEFFIQGHEGHWPYEHYINEVLVDFKGEEMTLLANKAKEHKVYIAGCILERDEDWIDDGYFFNTHFVIGPNGDVVHKYRKLTVATHYELAVSPHDVYDKYVEMYGDDLSSFFPVTDTEIGKIGTITCMDGHFPETARALGMQGAEVILHPLLTEPSMTQPMEIWQSMNKMRAWENVSYVVGASWGGLNGALRPKTFAPGKSMIVNYNGVVTAYADSPGEAIISSVINLEELRRRRVDPSRNFPTLLRNEIYKKIYTDEVYPPNQFVAQSPATREARDPMETIRQFIDKDIYKLPNTVPSYLKK